MRLSNITETRDEYLDLELAAAAGVFVRDVIAMERGAEVLITTDSRTDLRVSRAIARAVAAAGGVPVQLHYPSPGASYGASPTVVGAAAAASDIWVACSWNELIYSEAWSAAMAARVLYVSYGGLDVDGFVRCVGQVDTPKLAAMGQRVMDLLRDAEVHVSSAAGTDVRFHNRGGEMGKFRMIAGPERIPIMLAGQVTWEPNEASLEGVLVADGILSPPEEVGLIAEPVRFEVSAGRITNITGGREAMLLRRWLDMKGDPTLTRIAHASLGFNPGIPVPTGRILEDERAFGDIDFGWGAWVDRPAAGHFDFTCRQVSLSANGTKILREGRFVEPTLAALCREMGVPGH
jgi:leucyl aminopeptidase (aminopeptidase T)